MLWAPEKLTPVPPNCSKMNLDLDAIFSTSFIKGAQCAEFDTMTGVDGLIFPAGFHIVFPEGGKAYVSNPTGAEWLDAGFSVDLAADELHHFTFQTEFGWAAKTLTWLGIVIDGKPYKVQNAVVAANQWPGWEGATGFKFQGQIDNTPEAPLVSPIWDNINYTFMP